MAVPEIKFIRFLGEGTYGTVSLFKYAKPGKPLEIAVKTSDYQHAESLIKEFEILCQFKGCSRIIQCCENQVRANLNGEGNIEYMMVMEFAPQGNLNTYMTLFEDKRVPDPLIREYTRMLLEGLATIHGHGYVHCDLKPENILVFPRCVYENGEWRSFQELKISDFGVSKRDGDHDWWDPESPFVGTPIYMSPESVSHGETGKGLDLWSLGCVVLQMYTGKEPWWHKRNYDLKDLKKCLKKCHAPLIPKDLPFDAKLFIMTCFAFETDERKDASTLLGHSFLRGDDNNTTELPVNAKIENPRGTAQKPSQAASTSKRADA